MMTNAPSGQPACAALPGSEAERRRAAKGRWRRVAAGAKVRGRQPRETAPMRPKLAAALIALTPLAAAATESADPGAARALDIPVEEWAAMASGRTLTYAIGGAFWAIEHYYPGTSRVSLQFYDGTCLNGTWEYEAPLYCFHWEGEGTSCFRHVRVDDEILILETRDGVGGQQVMTGISDIPFACGPAPIS